MPRLPPAGGLAVWRRGLVGGLSSAVDNVSSAVRSEGRRIGLTVDLRVHEIQNPAEGNRTPDGTRTPTGTGSGHKSPRHANAPFARGIGGSTISEVVNFWKGSWAIGKGVNDVDWGTASELGAPSVAHTQHRL